MTHPPSSRVSPPTAGGCIGRLDERLIASPRRLRALLPVLLALTAVSGVPASLVAQDAAYRRGTDTLRFREVTRSEITLRTPRGEMPMAALHEAVVAVTSLPGDSVRAWYDSLVLDFDLPDGSRRLDTEMLLGEPFVLLLDSRGRVTRLSTPTLPEEVAQLTDLSRQFDDFFPRLPDAQLAAGTSWSDTVLVADTAADGRIHRTRDIGTYVVERDTSIRGEPAVIVRTRQHMVIESDGVVQQQRMRYSSRMEGIADGRFTFLTRAGRLHARSRTGELEGFVSYFGGPRPVRMAQRYRYSHEISEAR